MKKEIRFKIPAEIRSGMLEDLNQPHPWAFERVGFLFTKSKHLKDGTTIILATHYRPADDERYIRDVSVGARIDSTAIRKCMQEIFEEDCGCFHVHLHDHKGRPGPSTTDLEGLPGVAQSFANISKDQLTGYLILSNDSFFAQVWDKEAKSFSAASLVSVIGYPMEFHFDKRAEGNSPEIYKRQSFLGASSSSLLCQIRVGIVGYGGGGSHIGQQLAHVGVVNTVIYDDDKIEGSNMNRLVGAWFTDIKKALLKTVIAKRVIKKILPASKVVAINSRWQTDPEFLQGCDIVVGTVDTYAERQQLETECRRYLIPYIDIGMDVFPAGEKGYEIPGQVILSMPGAPCMQCFGFLTEEKLGKEAARYGAVGGNPQVIWPNGVLASTAVGIVADLITGWSGEDKRTVYLAYDGKLGVISNHIRIRYSPKDCIHYPLKQSGPVRFLKI